MKQGIIEFIDVKSGILKITAGRKEYYYYEGKFYVFRELLKKLYPNVVD